MKIYINLLPFKRKNEIRKNRIFRTIIWQEFIVFFIMFVFIALIFSTNFILKIQLDSLDKVHLEEQSRGNYMELQKYEDEFKKINSEISILNNIKGRNMHWLDIVDKLNGLVGNNILLTDLTTKDYLVLIVGQATSRNDLISFQEKLENEDCFYDINVPISNLVVKKNVNFQIDLSVKDECLIKN